MTGTARGDDGPRSLPRLAGGVLPGCRFEMPLGEGADERVRRQAGRRNGRIPPGDAETHPKTRIRGYAAEAEAIAGHAARIAAHCPARWASDIG